MLFVKNEEILARVDHTALKATATWQEIRTLCEEALEYHTASVCIPPSYVARAHAEFPGLNICTVIGFPLGYNTTACKVFETQQAVREGASEVDMVVNLGDVKNGDFDAVEKEIEALKKAAEDDRFADLKEKFDRVEAELKDDTQTNLETYRKEIVETINNDIVMRHGYSEGVIEHSLKDDPEVLRATEILGDGAAYTRIVTEQDTPRK